MVRDLTHPAWQVYDEHRTARLNVKYFGVKLARARRQNLWMEFFIALAASSSAVSGWNLWQSRGGRIIWSLVAGSAAVLAILKPLLRPTERIRVLQEVVGGYRVLDHDLYVLGLAIQQRGVFDSELVSTLQTALKRKGDLIAKDPDGVVDKALLRTCMAEVRQELPAERFWVPGEKP